MPAAARLPRLVSWRPLHKLHSPLARLPGCIHVIRLGHQYIRVTRGWRGCGSGIEAWQLSKLSLVTLASVGCETGVMEGALFIRLHCCTDGCL